ncbi:hypothetical protein SPWS13_3834 [Shewanella putrefaciens]|nr:hypothetical protein SPWS13_3834 [Shewanella putrefaciens]
MILHLALSTLAILLTGYFYKTDSFTLLDVFVDRTCNARFVSLTLVNEFTVIG